VVDYHVDRPEVEALQGAELTGTNSSEILINLRNATHRGTGSSSLYSFGPQNGCAVLGYPNFPAAIGWSSGSPSRRGSRFGPQTTNVVWGPQQVSGAHGGGDPPVPIPNTAVKPTSADDSRAAGPLESRSVPDYENQSPSPIASGFVIRWRPVAFTPWLIGLWLFGSAAITWIVVMEADGSRYAIYAYAGWAVAFAVATFVAFSFALNRTRVGVKSGKLFVRTLPLPWQRNSATDIRGISDVFVKSYVTSAYKGTGGRLFAIFAKTTDGKTIPIVSNAMIGAGTRAEAEDFARQIEAMLWKAGAS
jgi:hypothetical protein